MSSKEEIIRQQYEKKYGTQKYDNSVNRKMIFDYVSPAMDEFSKQDSISFAEWLEEKYVRSGYKKLSGEIIWKRKASGKSTLEELTWELTTEEIYDLYNQQKAK